MSGLSRIPANPATSKGQTPDGSADASFSGAVSNQTTQLWNNDEADLFNKWAAAYESSAFKTPYNNPYFDHFFSGQDISVIIDGMIDSSDELPIYNFGYNITQQKTPLYGFWSYTHDAMLRGTRIVNGAFSVVSMYPTMMTDAIAKAARFRAQTVAANQIAQTGINQIRGLDDDETRIDRYWRRNYDSNLDSGQQHLFSVHPPFNLVVRFGTQVSSLVATSPANAAALLRSQTYSQDIISQDLNERLVESLPRTNTDMSILLENVELTSKSMEYNVDGDPILETYTFLARDERLLKPIDKSQLQPAVPDPVTTGDTVGNSGTVGGGGGGGVVRQT